MSLKALIQSTLLGQTKVAYRPGVAADWDGTPFDVFNVPAPILVHYMFGYITTLMGVGNAIPRIQFTSVAPAATVPLSAATAAIAGWAVGSIIMWTGALAAAPAAGAVLAAADIAASPLWTGRILLGPGTIIITNAVACNAGIIDWYLFYTPCQPQTVTPL